MKDSVSFMLNGYVDTEESVSKLNKILNAIDINCSIRYVNERPFLTFDYDDEVVRQKITRKAGRKKTNIKNYMTVGELRKMQQKLSNAEIARQLGISRATFYRKLEQYKGTENDTDIFI